MTIPVPVPQDASTADHVAVLIVVIADHSPRSDVTPSRLVPRGAPVLAATAVIVGLPSPAAAVMFTLAAAVIGPWISGSTDPAQPAVTENVVHDVHHES